MDIYKVVEYAHKRNATAEVEINHIESNFSQNEYTKVENAIKEVIE